MTDKKVGGKQLQSPAQMPRAKQKQPDAAIKTALPPSGQQTASGNHPEQIFLPRRPAGRCRGCPQPLALPPVHGGDGAEQSGAEHPCRRPAEARGAGHKGFPALCPQAALCAERGARLLSPCVPPSRSPPPPRHAPRRRRRRRSEHRGRPPSPGAGGAGGGRAGGDGGKKHRENNRSAGERA